MRDAGRHTYAQEQGEWRREKGKRDGVAWRRDKGARRRAEKKKEETWERRNLGKGGGRKVEGGRDVVAWERGEWRDLVRWSMEKGEGRRAECPG